MNHLQEKEMSEHPMFVFHVSNEPGLTKFIPRLLDSYHLGNLKNTKMIYTTSSRAFASAFSFKWTDDEVQLGSLDDNKSFSIIVPERMVDRLMEPVNVSMYSFKFNKFNLEKIRGNTTPEYVSYKPLDVFKEDRYKSPWECMQLNGLEIVIK